MIVVKCVVFPSDVMSMDESIFLRNRVYTASYRRVVTPGRHQNFFYFRMAIWPENELKNS